MSAASEYAELLKLIEVSGPFISLPVFKEVFPQGLVKDLPPLTREMRELYDDWCEARDHAKSSVGPAQREWLRAVFNTLLNWPAERLAEANSIPQNLSYFVAQHHETLRPDAVLLEDGNPLLLITFLPPPKSRIAGRPIQPGTLPARPAWQSCCRPPRFQLDW